MTVTSQPVGAPTSAELEVQRIRGLVNEHRFGEAVTAAGSLRTLFPENRAVLYLLAVGQRHTRRMADALHTLADLERYHPGASRLYQDRGHCYVALKDAPRAVHASDQPVR